MPWGDVDLAVYVLEALPERRWVGEAGLAVALEPAVGLPVDVLVLSRAPVALRPTPPGAKCCSAATSRSGLTLWRQRGGSISIASPCSNPFSAT
ncbi:MAG: nucleotidyltransferase domain-containing protein [Desulfotomaculales bacterium]